jgi:hypothetical protein
VVAEHYGSTVVDYITGLDGRYRYNEIEGQGTVAVRGEWTDDDTLLVDYHAVGGAWHTLLKLTFKGEEVIGLGRGMSASPVPFSGTAAR